MTLSQLEGIMDNELFEPAGDWRAAFQRRQAEDAFIRRATKWAAGFMLGVVVFVVLAVM